MNNAQDKKPVTQAPSTSSQTPQSAQRDGDKPQQGNAGSNVAPIIQPEKTSEEKKTTNSGN